MRNTARAQTPAASDPASRPNVVLAAVGKRYGEQWALRDVSLELRPGIVHGLAGENGAGKSTCIGIIAGRVVPSAGEVRIGGQLVELPSPRASLALGVSTVYQELTIVPQLSALENVFLGLLPRTHTQTVRRSQMIDQYREVTGRLGLRIAPGAQAGTLSTGDRQMLEIARALVRGGRTLLLDEPTAALGEAEKERLISIVRDLAADGLSVTLVTHDLEEMLDLCDTVTVFRNGRLISTAPAAQWNRERMIREMAGRDSGRLTGQDVDVTAAEAHHPDSAGTSAVSAAPRSSVSIFGADIFDKIRGLAMETPSGQITGVAGLMGSGRSSLLKALAGAEPPAAGELGLNGRQVGWPRTIQEGLRLGLRYLPEDRKQAGLLLRATGLENIMLGSWGSTRRSGVISLADARAKSLAAAAAVKLDDSALAKRASQLSGGNQQKLLLARAACAAFDVLLADEPTRGVDVNARAEIWATLRRFVDEGKTVVAAVSDVDELLEVADGVLAISRGHRAHYFPDVRALPHDEAKALIIETMFRPD
jgi:ABC-type sugar transport system ATPase subunit